MPNLRFSARSGLGYPPAKTLGLPAATLVQPDIASPILPVPTLFVNTVVDPTAIGAECDGQGTPGSKCPVLSSPCLETGMLLANTLPEPTARVIPLQ